MQNVRNFNTNVVPVIAAGGYGQIHTGVPKVVELVDGLPMIVHVANVFKEMFGATDPVVVINREFGQAVRGALEVNGFNPYYVVQEYRVGNAGAVKLCLPHLDNTRWAAAKHVALLYGDMPCWRPESIRRLLQNHLEEQSKMTMFGINVHDPNCPDVIKTFGRIIWDKDDRLLGVYEPDTLATLDPDLVGRAEWANPSAFILNRRWLEVQLPKLKPHDIGDGHPSELWMPDLVGRAVDAHNKVTMIPLSDPYEALGVNDAEELQVVRDYMEQRRRARAV